jgi:hypothetical protein
MTDLHIVALLAGDDLYVYRGYHRERLRDRMRIAELAMIGANLDTQVTWLQPEHYHETYTRLVSAAGSEHVHEMWKKGAEVPCIVCGADQSDVMSCHIFVHDRSGGRHGHLQAVDGVNVRDLRLCLACNGDRGGNGFGLLEYRQLTRD